jgi:hypothetical protein
MPTPPACQPGGRRPEGRVACLRACQLVQPYCGGQTLRPIMLTPINVGVVLIYPKSLVIKRPDSRALAPAPPWLSCAMAGSTGNLPACHLLGATFASALYSLYVLAFGASIYFLFNVRGRRVQPNRILLAVSVILFLCVTVVRPSPCIAACSLLMNFAALVHAHCLYLHGVRRPWRHGQRCSSVLQWSTATPGRATVCLQRDHRTFRRCSRAFFLGAI